MKVNIIIVSEHLVSLQKVICNCSQMLRNKMSYFIFQVTFVAYNIFVIINLVAAFIKIVKTV
eukprot:UN09163